MREEESEQTIRSSHLIEKTNQFIDEDFRKDSKRIETPGQLCEKIENARRKKKKRKRDCDTCEIRQKFCEFHGS